MGGFLGLEPLMLARLRERVPGAKAVLAAADLAGVAEAEQATPALHVVFDGYRPTQEKGAGLVQEVEQRWMVVVAVRNVRDATGQAAREDAAPLVDATLAALQGWRPAGYGSLRLEAGPRPGFSVGYLYIPLAFAVTYVTRGQP